jgi:SAM-dependent methyltransferase
VDDWLWYSVRRRLLDSDLEELCTHMTGYVLEIGNGRISRRGRFKPPTKKVEAWIYLDLDVKKFPHVRADVEHLPIGDNMFDTVVCLEVMEYVIDPQETLSEIRRVLKPDGKLILSTPFLHRTDTPHDYWRFTEHGLCSLLQQACFEVVWIKAQGRALGVAVNILKYAIYIQQNPWLRHLLDWVTRPFFYLMLKMDNVTAKHNPLLATFSTGYLIMACVKKNSSMSSTKISVCVPEI